MPQKLRVAILFGGRSVEHEISLLSARFVVEALDPARFEPILIGIDKGGRWLLQEEAVLLGATTEPQLQKLNASMPEVALSSHPPRSGGAALTIGGREPARIDVVFPVLHGTMGEDGSVQGLLEIAGVPYVGAGVLGSAVGMDKDVMKRLLRDAGLPIVPHVVVRRAEYERDKSGALARLDAIGLPCFVKPANSGSSVGIGRATDARTLAACIEEALAYDEKVLVEAAVDHPREVECSVLGNDDPVASVPGEITVDHADGFYSYAAKYVDEKGATLTIPAALTEDQTQVVQHLAVRAFRALECSGMARIDFFLSRAGEILVNEINTIPGFTAVSMYPKLWEASGVSSRELVTRLIDLALERAARRKKLRTTI